MADPEIAIATVFPEPSGLNSNLPVEDVPSVTQLKYAIALSMVESFTRNCKAGPNGCVSADDVFARKIIPENQPVAVHSTSLVYSLAVTEDAMIGTLAVMAVSVTSSLEVVVLFASNTVPVAGPAIVKAPDFVCAVELVSN
jgi:hypothetical protein